MIAVSQLSKRFGRKRVLLGLDLNVQPGECVVLLGANGSGKTTLLRILATLSKPDHGTVRVAGCTLPEMADQARWQIGFLSHQPMLYDELSASENLAFFARMYCLTENDKQFSLLRHVGLWRVRNQQTRYFSRGMKQRLALARLMLLSPRVLLLDEPYTGLDADAADLLDDFLQTARLAGSSILLSVHDGQRLLPVADRFDILQSGCIRASQPASSLNAESLTTLYRQGLMREVSSDHS